MTPGEIGLVAFTLVAVFLAVAEWFGWTVGRLDRLHLRCDGARSVLEAALARRRALVLELVVQPSADPAPALLLTDAAAHSPTGADALRWHHVLRSQQRVRRLCDG